MNPIPSNANATNGIAPTSRRRRSSSIKQVYNYVKDPPPTHHLLHLERDEAVSTTKSIPSEQEEDEPTPLVTEVVMPRTTRARALSGGRLLSGGKKKPLVRKKETKEDEINYGPGYLRWLQRPADSLYLIAVILVLYAAWEIVIPVSITVPNNYNPFKPMLFLSHPLVPTHNLSTESQRYGKGWGDLAFLSFYVIVFSCARQSLTMYWIKGFGLRRGIKPGRKLERFMEQGYAVIYFTCSSLLGLYVMSQQKSWWFKTEHFFLDYPHGGPAYANGGMMMIVKLYYLLQFSYWLQQALVMIAGLEKKRDDYIELILHHVITLYLVGVSYSINMTQIGIAIFVSMDIPDVILAVSKCVNYVALDTKSKFLENTGNCCFIVFMVTWGYLRHYQNIRILYAVLYKYDLIPTRAAKWSPSEGFFLPLWMKSGVFIPIFLLQLVIAFWSYLILRIVVRMILGNAASDVREDTEEGAEEKVIGGGGSETEGRKRK